MLKILAAVFSLGTLGALFRVYTWWDSKASAVRRTVREAAPELYFHVGSFGGPAGNGFTVNLQNKSTIASAFDLAVTLPGIDGIAWRADSFAPQQAICPSVSVPDNALVRTKPMPGAKIDLTYRDRFGLPYRITLDFIQQRRADGFYNFGSDRPIKTNPKINIREVWRLRQEV